MEESTERDDTALFVLYKTGGNGMTKTISDETREYFCYIKQKVRKGEKVMEKIWEDDKYRLRASNWVRKY